MNIPYTENNAFKTAKSIKVGELCAGIGGFGAGFEQAGFETAWQVEFDNKANSVLERHFPYAKRIIRDIRLAGKDNLEPVQVIVGGTPCQGFSIAGLRGGLNDDRSNLCFQFCRICDELNPEIIVWENVPGVFSDPTNAFGCFLAALVGAAAPLVPPANTGGRWTNAGMVAGPRRHACWRVLDSQYFGVAQRRERVFVVADTSGGRCAEILFESPRLLWHPPARGQAGESPAATLRGGTKSGSNEPGNKVAVSTPWDNQRFRLHDANGVAPTLATSDEGGGQRCPNVAIPFSNSGHGVYKEGVSPVRATGGGGEAIICLPETVGALTNGAHNGAGVTAKTPTVDESSLPEVAGCLQERDANGCDSNTKPGRLIVVRTGGFFDDVAHTLRDEHDASEDGTGRGTPLVATAYRTSGNDGVRVQGDKTGALNCATDPNQNIVAIRTAQTSSNGKGIDEFGAAYTLDGAQGQAVLAPRPVAFTQNQSGDLLTGDVAPAMVTNQNATGRNTSKVNIGMQVRRLTPTECERLQGFEDGWNEWGRWDGKNKPQADSPRYKQLGNAVTVSVIKWIALRVKTNIQ